VERIFGTIMQNAFVVPDLDAALDHWTRVMGVGPFFVFEHVQYAEAWHRGRVATDIDMTVAIAYWGSMQIELVCQLNSAPSIFTEFAARDLGGLQHMGVITESVDRDLARLALRGIEPVQQGTTRAGLRFAYVATDRHPGGMIELIESSERVLRFFDKMRRAAEQWDGAQPIRRMG
jgi:hypothetical protein